MTTGDAIILLVLILVLVLIFRSARKNRNRSCSGDCAHCGQVDWEKIRCELHQEKERKAREESAGKS